MGVEVSLANSFSVSSKRALWLSEDSFGSVVVSVSGNVSTDAGIDVAGLESVSVELSSVPVDEFPLFVESVSGVLFVFSLFPESVGGLPSVSPPSRSPSIYPWSESAFLP